ncbi:hypothetical protein ACQP2P_11465 [Dactylosporangium sp. CA-139114]|uniref:hypothetical protein n=1 Tax=Dactylosporangium sp. CA-139114 TaxID=3239931 RepID=UPI003D98C221
MWPRQTVNDMHKRLLMPSSGGQRLPRRRVMPRATFDATHRSVAAQLAANYYQSARTEAIQRLGFRDAGLFLFLASSITVFGVAVGQSPNVDVLYGVPVLGVGAAHVYAQHSRVIGALGRYMAIDLERSIEPILGERCTPMQWDSSDTLLRRGGHNLPVFLSALLLILVPEVAATAMAVFAGGVSRWDIVGGTVGFFCAAVSAYTLFSVHKVRMGYIFEINAFRTSQGRPVQEAGKLS